MFIVIAIAPYLSYAGPATGHNRPQAAQLRQIATPTPILTGTPKPVRPLSPGPIIGLICVIVTSSVALGFAFSIRRRIDAIAGPDPEKEHDD